MVELHVLHGPHVMTGSTLHPIPTGAERLTVLVALRGPIRRTASGRLLWPRADSRRAAGNLRSATWRLRAAGCDLLGDADGWLRIRPEVAVDVRRLDDSGNGLTSAVGAAGNLPVETSAVLTFLLGALDVLPGWYDDWLVLDRERIRARALETLDRLSVRFSIAGRWAEAIDTALIAVTCDPLRESSQIALLQAHLGEGNLGEARRAYDAYRAQLRADVGLAPSASLAKLVTVGV